MNEEILLAKLNAGLKNVYKTNEVSKWNQKKSCGSGHRILGVCGVKNRCGIGAYTIFVRLNNEVD